MIKTIFAVDNQDSGLGSFFSECLQDILNYDNKSIELEILRSNSLQNDIVTTSKLNDITKFIFLAYSHGNDDALAINIVTPYISSTINADKFKDSFFYTCSCHTGKILGKALVDNGCSSYIGYNDKFTVWGYNTQPFVECANYGFKLFLQGDDVDTVIKKMKDKYDEHFENYNNDLIGAAFLLSNKNALVAHGNGKCNLSNFV